MLKEVIKSMFSSSSEPKSLEDEVWSSDESRKKAEAKVAAQTSVEKRKKKRLEDLFIRILKLRVPGFSDVYTDRKEVLLEISAPLPGYDIGHAFLCFEAERSMQVKHQSARDGLSEIFEACLGACQYSDLVVGIPSELHVFYGTDDIVVFKKGETLESLSIEADLNTKSGSSDAEENSKEQR